MDKIEALWSGKFPCLCHGKWILKVNGEDVSDKIPIHLREAPMETFEKYNTWRFVNHLEEWYSYFHGLNKNEWINKNKEWLNTISEEKQLQEAIFDAIQAKDWRYNTCGGCI